jgi:ABC-type oligopeptide transport system substrate-binding subunit
MTTRGLALAAVLLGGGCGKAEPPLPEPPTEAQRLLAEAGFPGGRGFPRLTLLHNTADWHKRIAAAVQEMWRLELGIRADIENAEWRVYLDRVDAGDFDIARRAWIGEYSDPHAFLALFHGHSGANATGWRSEPFERLLDDSDAETDPARRLAILAEAEGLLLAEAPLAPIYHYVNHNYMKPFIRGVFPNVRDMHPLQEVTLEGEGSPKDGVLIFNAAEEPNSLDPAVSHDVAGAKILMHLFEGLVGYDPRDASPVPAAAERWEFSPDRKTWTFHLRPALWSNGDPVTAHDFVYAWRRVVDPKTLSRYADRMFVVKGARAIHRGAAPPESLGARAGGDRTLVVELEHPAPYFIELACLNIFYPVHRAAVEKHGTEWTSPANLVHNGPYRLASWVINDKKVFEKNPRYRAAAEVKLAKFVFLGVRDDAAAWRLYHSGACHWLFRAPPDMAGSVADRPDHLTGPYNAVYFYVFNVKKKPLDDPRVRRALSLAIDRGKITGRIVKSGEMPAFRFVPPTARPAPLPK